MEVWEAQAAARTKNENDQSESDKPLKRPLHKPVVVSKASSSRKDDDRKDGSSRRRSGDRSSGRRSDEGRDRRGDSYRGSGRR
jgi:hypothetical protein